MELKLTDAAGKEILSFEQLKIADNDVVVYSINNESLDFNSLIYNARYLGDKLKELGVKNFVIIPMRGNDALQVGNGINMVKIPVSIGTRLFWRNKDTSLVEHGRVSMLQQKANFSWKIRISRRGSWFDIKENEIGVRFFISKWEV